MSTRYSTEFPGASLAADNMWLGCHWKYCDSIIKVAELDTTHNDWLIQPNYHRPDTSLMFCSRECLNSWLEQASEFEKTGMEPDESDNTGSVYTVHNADPNSTLNAVFNPPPPPPEQQMLQMREYTRNYARRA